MTPEQIREHAEELILDHATDIEFLSISERLADTAPDLDNDAHDQACRQIDDLIRRATVTVEFACDRTDLPEDPDARCADCGQRAGNHAARSAT